MYQRTRAPRQAAALLETAAVLGVFLTLILATMEYGRFLMMRELIDNAAREGARQAVAGTDRLATSDITNVVVGSLAGQAFQNVAVQVYAADPTTGANVGAWTDATFGNAVAVQVTANYSAMLPSLGFLPTTVGLNATAVLRSEAN